MTIILLICKASRETKIIKTLSSTLLNYCIILSIRLFSKRECNYVLDLEKYNLDMDTYLTIYVLFSSKVIIYKE